MSPLLLKTVAGLAVLTLGLAAGPCALAEPEPQSDVPQVADDLGKPPPVPANTEHPGHGAGDAPVTGHVAFDFDAANYKVNFKDTVSSGYGSSTTSFDRHDTGFGWRIVGGADLTTPVPGATLNLDLSAGDAGGRVTDGGSTWRVGFKTGATWEADVGLGYNACGDRPAGGFFQCPGVRLDLGAGQTRASSYREISSGYGFTGVGAREWLNTYSAELQFDVSAGEVGGRPLRIGVFYEHDWYGRFTLDTGPGSDFVSEAQADRVGVTLEASFSHPQHSIH